MIVSIILSYLIFIGVVIPAAGTPTTPTTGDGENAEKQKYQGDAEEDDEDHLYDQVDQDEGLLFGLHTVE